MSGAKGPKARKAPANKAGVIWWSTDAEKRKRRRESRKARAALERNEALVWRRKTGRFFKNLAPGAVGQRETELGRKPFFRSGEPDVF